PLCSPTAAHPLSRAPLRLGGTPPSPGMRRHSCCVPVITSKRRGPLVSRGFSVICPENTRILLVNLHQSSRSTFSWGGFLRFFAFREVMLDTQSMAPGGWPTVSERLISTIHRLLSYPVFEWF